jgi:hypothetical protein
MTAMANARTDRKFVTKALQTMSSAPPAYWDCPCGCGVACAYARDASALWISSTGPTHASASVIGFENRGDLVEFVSREKAEALGHPDVVKPAVVKTVKQHFDMLFTVLEPLMPESKL